MPMQSLGYSHYGHEIFFTEDSSKYTICGREDSNVLILYICSAKINSTGPGSGPSMIIFIIMVPVLGVMQLPALAYDIGFIIKNIMAYFTKNESLLLRI
jgi:hypothetical protein